MDEFETYDFCLFRLPKDGGRVIWEITHSCNYDCHYCIFACGKNNKAKDELSTEEVINTLYQLKEKKFTHLKFTGGEPFIRNDFLTILKEAYKLGFTSDVSTNGSLITEEKAKEIKESHLQMVHVSLDGHNKEIHEIARGENTYDRTIKGINNLVKNNIYVRLGTVIFNKNDEYLEEMVNSAINLDVNEIIFSYMEPVGRIQDDYSLISKKTTDEIKPILDNLSNKYKNQIKISYSFSEKNNNNCDGKCPGLNKFLYVDNLGKISPCPWIVEKYPKYQSIKTLKEKSLNELLLEDEMKNYSNYKNTCGGCPYKNKND
jgi:radical SAM protein with 4Fe4S-binding SPASM domain